MTKIRLMRILLIVMSVLILIGIALMRCSPNKVVANSDNIKVVLSDRRTQIIEFENLSLIPGEECEYIIMLENADVGQCDIALDFREIGEKTLKHFVRVKVMSEENVLCDELLADLFEKDEIVFPVRFTENQNTELKIVYVMPAEVGNEAKNAESVFELRITASNE